jgi:four helix bundle protein
MTQLPHAKNHRDLIVYQKARQLAQDVFILTKTFPKEEMYSLTDQIRRSSRSVGAQITEAWAKRRYENYFLSKLTDADGEQHETQHWLEIAYDCNYLTYHQLKSLHDRCEEIGRLLNSMMNKSQMFCGRVENHLREPMVEYFISTPDNNSSDTDD